MRRLLPLVAVALVFVLGACGNDVLSPAAAEINGKEIPQGALDDELEAMRTNRQYLEFLQSQGNEVIGSGEATFNADFVRRVLTRQILLELVHQEVVRQDLRVSGQDRERVRRDVEQEVGGPDIFERFPRTYQDTLLRRSAEVVALQLELSDVEVDDQAVKAFYDENPELFVETCVSHILFAVVDDSGQVDTEQTAAQAPQLLAEAEAAHARLSAGEDFAALARELSKDTSNKDRGGDLECGPAGRFVPEFEAAMDATQPGQVSTPTQTQFGYHLVKVTSRSTQPFEAVTEEIRQRLLSQASQGFATFLTEALEAAKIEVNPRFGTFNKDMQNPSVIPPNAPTTLPVGGAPEGETQLPTDLGR